MPFNPIFFYIEYFYFLVVVSEMGGIYCFLGERYLGVNLGFYQGGGIGATPAGLPALQ